MAHAKPHLTVEHDADGHKVTKRHASRVAAYAYRDEQIAAGRDVFAYPEEAASDYQLRPSVAPGSPDEVSPGRSAYQTGTVERVFRSDLKAAPYNPRNITPERLDKLRENIRKVGLVGPSVFLNRTTGNVLSGHKRLEALDTLHQGEDYQLDVTVVHWDLRKEKRQNAFLNNPQGTFDPGKLGDLLADDLDGIADFGFDLDDLGKMFGDDERFEGVLDGVGGKAKKGKKKSASEPPAAAVDDDMGDPLGDEAPARHDSAGPPPARRIVIECRDAEQRSKLLTALGVAAGDHHRAVSGDRVLEAIRVDRGY